MATTPTLSQPRVGNIPDVLAAVCAIGFIVVLAIAAYWDSSIRTLHAFEAVPYAIAAVLCLRQRKAGYILGVQTGSSGCGWQARSRLSFAMALSLWRC